MQQAVRDADSDHEALQGAAFSVLAAGYTRSVALGVNAPPTKIGAEPLWGNGVGPVAGKLAHVFPSFPWILGAFEALNSSCLGFFCGGCHKFLSPAFFCETFS